MSSSQSLLDAAGRRRSPATTPGFRTGMPPRNRGQRYPADPPTVDEIVAVMRQAEDTRLAARGATSGLGRASGLTSTTLWADVTLWTTFNQVEP